MAGAESPRKELAKNTMATTQHTHKQTVVQAHQLKKLAGKSKLKTLHLAEDTEIIMTFEKYLNTGLNKINTIMSVHEIPSYEEMISKNDYLKWWFEEMRAFPSHEEVCKDESSVAPPVVQRSQVNKSSNISKFKTFHPTEDLDMIITFEQYLETGLDKSSKLMNPHLFDRTKIQDHEVQAHEDKTNYLRNNIKEKKWWGLKKPSYKDLISKNDYLEWWFEEMRAFSSTENICKIKTTSFMGRLCVRIRNLIRRLNIITTFHK